MFFKTLTGEAGTDFIGVFSVQTFVPGSKSGDTKCVQITILDDTDFEAAKNFNVVLGSSNSNMRLATLVTIMDNDGSYEDFLIFYAFN